MKKYVLAILLSLASGLCLALPHSVAAEGYYCGMPAQGGQDAAWCSCFSTYFQDICKAQEDDPESPICTDVSLRSLITDFGGPEVACQILPNPKITPEQCVTTLTYYLASCPVV